MKKKLILLLCFLVSSCSNNVESTQPIEKVDHKLKIMVATDLHLLSNNLVGLDNQVYKKENLTSDGRVQEYDYILVNELLKQVKENDPDYLMLTGDLTFNGEKDSHDELVKALKLFKNYTNVLVIPGNHDYNNIAPMQFLNDEVKYAIGLNMDAFPIEYKEFGYEGAISYDLESLSYSYKLNDTIMALMIDSSISKYNYEYDTNFVGGELSANTLSWLEDQLKFATSNNMEVISFMHHNLLVHNEMFKSSYTLYNAEDLISLYKKYNVKVNFSGHLHIQSIKSQDGIYDISSGSVLDYGNRYGVLDIYSNCYDYNSYKLKPNVGFDFTNYSFDTFVSKYYNKQLYADSYYFKKNPNSITTLNSKINAYYFDGDYEAIHKLINENKSLVRKVKRNENYKYIQLIYEVENKNQHSVLIKK